MNSKKEQIRIFLNQICLKFGICDHLYDLDVFTEREYYEANQFIREVFEAEGLSPDLEIHLFRQVKKMFVDKFGVEIYINEENEIPD